MHIIKLSATASTNDFLKQLNSTQKLEDYTVIITEHQTQGKGQRGSQWSVNPHKNLTFSILITNMLTQNASIFDLNIAISTAIIQALNKLEIPKLNIKWPNDILSEGKKIAGILIENNISSSGSISSVVGIGLNVNQIHFENLPQASSLKNITQKEFDKEKVMLEIVKQIKKNCELITSHQTDNLWEDYHNCLFKKDIPTVFEYPTGAKCMGIIKQVLPNGKIQILLEDSSVKEFDLKEVKMIY